MGEQRAHHESIGDVARDPLQGGADGAYKQLRSDVIGTDAYDTRTAHSRMEEATRDMADQGVLPQVSAAWLKNEFSRIDTSGNGYIERDEIIAAEEQRTRFGAFDATFGRVFDDQLFDKISSMDDRIGQNNISKGDLNRYLRRDDRANRKEMRQEDSRDELAPLYQGADPAINYINTDGNRRVSRNEMQAFMRDYEKFHGNGPYTQENARLVDDLLHGRVDSIHHGGAGGFSARHSAKAMGLESAHGRRHKDFSLVTEDYDKARPYSHDEPDVAPPDPRGGDSTGDTPPPGHPIIDAVPNCRDTGAVQVENYTVKKGDCVWNIAKDHMAPERRDRNREVHKYVRQISRANELDRNGRSPDLIYPGENLRIPARESGETRQVEQQVDEPQIVEHDVWAPEER